MFSVEISPRRWRRLALAAAVIWFVGCLLYSAPASLFAALLQRAAPVQLSGVEGSFWHGRAAAADILWQGQRFALGRLEWRLNPWSLLWLHPGAQVSTHYGEQFLDTRLRLTPTGSVQLRDTRAALPLTALGRWLPLPAGGLLAADFAAVDIRGRELRLARGSVFWQRAQWQWNNNWLVLGDYRCQLDLQDAQAAHCTLQGDGALAMQGEVALDLQQKTYSLDAQLTAQASLPQDFRDGLGLILAAERDAQGRWLVRRNGKW